MMPAIRPPSASGGQDPRVGEFAPNAIRRILNDITPGELDELFEAVDHREPPAATSLPHQPHDQHGSTELTSNIKFGEDARDALHVARLLRLDEVTAVRIPAAAEEAPSRAAAARGMQIRVLAQSQYQFGAPT